MPVTPHTVLVIPHAVSAPPEIACELGGYFIEAH
jgi:hypothetical protein